MFVRKLDKLEFIYLEFEYSVIFCLRRNIFKLNKKLIFDENKILPFSFKLKIRNQKIIQKNQKYIEKSFIARENIKSDSVMQTEISEAKFPRTVFTLRNSFQ